VYGRHFDAVGKFEDLVHRLTVLHLIGAFRP
jgi:hypothetical protein